MRQIKWHNYSYGNVHLRIVYAQYSEGLHQVLTGSASSSTGTLSSTLSASGGPFLNNTSVSCWTEERESVCVCVCVCQRERERERESVWVWVGVREFA